MAKKRKPAMAAVRAIDLQHLRQCELSWLLGKSPQWIRGHSHVFERDGRGLYDGRKAVAAYLVMELNKRTAAGISPELLNHLP